MFPLCKIDFYTKLEYISLLCYNSKKEEVMINKLHEFYQGTDNKWYCVIDTFTTKNAGTEFEHIDHDRYAVPQKGADSFEDLQKIVKKHYGIEIKQ